MLVSDHPIPTTPKHQRGVDFDAVTAFRRVVCRVARQVFYMKPELIEAIKEAAATNDQKAWQWVENAVKRALKSKKT